MSKKNKNPNTPSPEADAEQSALSVAGGETSTNSPTEPAAPQASVVAGGGNSVPSPVKHSDRGRFCIQARDASGQPAGEHTFTDNPHVAYAAVCRGARVIDHDNGNREYDGTVPKK